MIESSIRSPITLLSSPQIAEQATYLLFNCWSNSEDRKDAIVGAVKQRLSHVKKALEKARAAKPPVQRSKSFLEDIGLN